MNGFKLVFIWKLGINGIEYGLLATYWKFWRWNSFPWEVVQVHAKSGLTWDFSPFYFGSVHYTNTISDDLATYFMAINVTLNHTVNEAELNATSQNVNYKVLEISVL